jgi:N-acetylneuraminic acid mutarotase
MTTLGTQAFLFGGFDATTELADSWLFSGSTWTPVNMTGPSAREGAGLATLGTKVILFGGLVFGTHTVLGDTWVFDGSAWSPLTLAPSPPARFAAGMATIGSHVVLFGGLPCEGTCDAGATPLDDTWLFDGTAWSLAASAGALNPPRAYPATAALGSRVIAFGGTESISVPLDPGPDLSDTWAFDGTTFTWSNLNIASAPPSRAAATMAAVGSELVLFGGHGYPAGVKTFLSDTWIFNGSTWTAPSLSSSPPPRDRASMTGLP